MSIAVCEYIYISICIYSRLYSSEVTLPGIWLPHVLLEAVHNVEINYIFNGYFYSNKLRYGSTVFICHCIGVARAYMLNTRRK